jgi:hypothetical protein
VRDPGCSDVLELSLLDALAAMLATPRERVEGRDVELLTCASSAILVGGSVGR